MVTTEHIRSVAFAMTTSWGGAIAGCANEYIEEPVTTAIAVQPSIGDSLDGISAEDFAAARAAFNTVEELDDGLGPIYNERACGNCHTQGAAGGAGVQIERRFGKFANGVFHSLSHEGGSLRQLFTVGTFTGRYGQTCAVPLEHEPSDATVHNVGRLTTPLFGLGLVDAMPDWFFEQLAAGEPAAVRGTVHRVKILLPNPNDPSQRLEGTRVGRYGWKAGVSNLVQFAADAYLNEMGITTQHCIAGTSVLSFATESKPNGVAQPLGCDDRGPGGPGIPPGTDEGVGSCDGGRTEIQDDVRKFANFMTFLAPPPQNTTLDPDVAAQGAAAFLAAGCADCHNPGPFKTPQTTPNGVPGNFTFYPFSDFLLHDMGALGDLIGNDGDPIAKTRRMRTAPLWGLRFRTKFLHDGRTSDIATAIRAHDGQGTAAAAAFDALGTSDQAALIRLLQAI